MQQNRKRLEKASSWFTATAGAAGLGSVGSADVEPLLKSKLPRLFYEEVAEWTPNGQDRIRATARHPSLDLKVCSVDKRVACHREIDAVRPARQPCRLEVENVSARAAQRGIEAEIIIWV